MHSNMVPGFEVRFLSLVLSRTWCLNLAVKLKLIIKVLIIPSYGALVTFWTYISETLPGEEGLHWLVEFLSRLVTTWTHLGTRLSARLDTWPHCLAVEPVYWLTELLLDLLFVNLVCTWTHSGWIIY